MTDPTAARAALMRIYDALLLCERQFLDTLPDVPSGRQAVGLDALLERYDDVLAENPRDGADYDELAEQHIEYHAGRS